LQATYHIIELPMDSYYIRYAPVALSFWAVVIINVGTLFFCTLALLLPLRIIKNISPIKAIRFD
jgi:lipoprotein-releasing system permease protein